MFYLSVLFGAFGVGGVAGGQIVVPPLYSPCEFPSPLYTNPNMFRLECLTVPNLPFICDLHHQLAHADLSEIEKAYHRYHHFLSRNGTSTIGVIIVKQLQAPSSTKSVYDQAQYRCLLDDECGPVDVENFVNNVRIFMTVYASKVYSRWFIENEKDSECPHHANVLALLVIDGLVNDPRKIPYVRLHTSEPRLRISLGNIQSEANNGLAQGWPLQETISHLVDDIGYAMKEFHVLGGEARSHSIPAWAIQVGILCAVLVVLALFVEWYVVRRKLGVQRSSGGTKISSGKSKTHLMF